MATQQPRTAAAALQAAAESLAAAMRLLPDVEALPATEVAAVLDAAASVDRLADAAMVRITGVIASRSDGVDPDHSVARQCGAPNTKQLLHRVTGHRMRHVRTLQSLAAATTQQVSLTGAPIEGGYYPVVHAALDDGALTLDQADAIVTNLSEAKPRSDSDDLAMAEREAVALATGTFDDDLDPCTAEETARIARHLKTRLDTDGKRPTEDAQVASRSLRVAERADGMIAGSFLLPPAEGAILLQALQAFGKPGTKPRFLTAEEAADQASANDELVDDRTTEQRNADTLIGCVKRAVELADSPRIGGEAPTLVVTVTQSAIDAHRAGKTTTESGEPAVATIEHTGAEVSVDVADAIACDGKVQTLVTDDDGHPLRLGRASRLFTTAMRRAIAVRDKGCVGCGKPPGFTQVHHLDYWMHGGRTDVDNGILVCDWCHHEVHRGHLHPVRGADGRYRLRPTIPVNRRRPFRIVRPAA